MPATPSAEVSTPVATEASRTSIAETSVRTGDGFLSPPEDSETSALSGSEPVAPASGSSNELAPVVVTEHGPSPSPAQLADCNDNDACPDVDETRAAVLAPPAPADAPCAAQPVPDAVSLAHAPPAVMPSLMSIAIPGPPPPPPAPPPPPHRPARPTALVIRRAHHAEFDPVPRIPITPAGSYYYGSSSREDEESDEGQGPAAPPLPAPTRRDKGKAPAPPPRSLRGSGRRVASMDVEMQEVVNNDGHNVIKMLPPEMLVSIFGFLGMKDIQSGIRVCKTWRSATKDPRLWRWHGHSDDFRRNCPNRAPRQERQSWPLYVRECYLQAKYDEVGRRIEQKIIEEQQEVVHKEARSKMTRQLLPNACLGLTCCSLIMFFVMLVLKIEGLVGGTYTNAVFSCFWVALGLLCCSACASCWAERQFIRDFLSVPCNYLCYILVFLLMVIFLMLRADSKVLWTWENVFAPMYVVLAPLVFLVLGTCVMFCGQTCRRANGRTARLFAFIMCLVTGGLGAALITWQVLFTQKLNGQTDKNWTLVLLPLLLSLIGGTIAGLVGAIFFYNSARRPASAGYAAAAIIFAGLTVFVGLCMRTLDYGGISWLQVFIPIFILCFALLCFLFGIFCAVYREKVREHNRGSWSFC